MRVDHSEIFEQFIEWCPGVRLPSEWDYLGVDDSCRFLTDDIDHAIELLQREYETRRLLESQLVVRDDNGQLGLNPRLMTQDQLFVVLRNQQGQIFDLITSSGSISGRNAMVLLRQDASTQDSLQRHDRMFLVFSMVDVILFRALGLAAMHAAEVVNFRRDGLQRLLWLVGGFSDGPIRRKQTQFSWEGRIMLNESGYVGPQESAPHEFEVVICAFCLNSFDRTIPVGITSVARHLAQAERHLEIHFDALAVWWPTEDDMSNLAYRNELQTPDMLSGFLAAEHELLGVEHFIDPSRPPAAADTFVHALEKLLQTLGEGGENWDSQRYLDREREAFAKFESELDKTIFKPLLESAIASPGLLIRPLRVQLAHVSKMLHSSMPRMHFIQKRQQHTGSQTLPEESLKTVKTLTDQMIKLTKEVHRLSN